MQQKALQGPLSPCDEKSCWNTTPPEIPSPAFVGPTRRHRKAIATDSSPDRDQQFRYISSLRTHFQREGLPIISVDTKKRELVGNFKNNGVKWDRTPVRVNDHDFRSDAIGVASPYGIYDLLANRGSVFVGVSHDTAAFAVHSIAGWWKRDGADRYRGQKLLILADRRQQ